jgi:hypothetical protein
MARSLTIFEPDPYLAEDIWIVPSWITLLTQACAGKSDEYVKENYTVLLTRYGSYNVPALNWAAYAENTMKVVLMLRQSSNFQEASMPVDRLASSPLHAYGRISRGVTVLFGDLFALRGPGGAL